MRSSEISRSGFHALSTKFVLASGETGFGSRMGWVPGDFGVVSGTASKGGVKPDPARGVHLTYYVDGSGIKHVVCVDCVCLTLRGDYSYTVESAVSSLSKHTEGCCGRAAGWHPAGGLAVWSRVLLAWLTFASLPALHPIFMFIPLTVLLAPNPTTYLQNWL